MSESRVGRRGEINMIEGPLAGKILKFALPLAATSILQQLFNAADVAVVGQLVGPDAMAAVGSNGPIVGLFLQLLVGTSLGANIVISRFTGQRDKEGVHRTVHTAFLFAIILGFIVLGIGQILVSPLHGMMGNPIDVRPAAELYMRIYLMGLPVMALYNFESAIFRSQGDTKTPLICLVIAGGINVCLNIFFVSVVGLEASGVALATVISNGISSLLMFIVLCRTKMEVRLRRKEMRIDGKILKNILRVGIPSGIQGMVFAISNMSIQSAINFLGKEVMAASSAAFNVEIFPYYLFHSFSQAATTFTSQNYGAVKPDRCKKALRLSLIMGLIITGICCALILIFVRPILSIFNDSTFVIEYGAIRLFYICGFESANVILEIMSGAMRGYGRSLGPALMALFGICGTRIIWVNTIFLKSSTFETVMLSYPISWAITLVLVIIYYFITVPKIQAGMRAQMNN